LRENPAGNKQIMSYTPRLKEKYRKEIVPALQKKFGFKSPMRVPRLKKICFNQGVNGAVADKRLVESVVNEMTLITGQKAVPTFAKKDISNFKVRKGVAIGVKVTLRGDRMYEFLDRLTAVALPRTRDFKGVNRNSFDGKGNYTLGVKEQIIFPEIDIDKVTKMNGFDITIVTSAKSDEETLALLESFGMPFNKK
jgi:large subunit ribosomal protein L5